MIVGSRAQAVVVAPAINLYAGLCSYNRLAVALGTAATVGHDETASIAVVIYSSASTVLHFTSEVPAK